MLYPLKLSVYGKMDAAADDVSLEDADGKTLIAGCGCCGSPFSEFTRAELEEWIERVNKNHKCSH